MIYDFFPLSKRRYRRKSNVYIRVVKLPVHDAVLGNIEKL